MKEQFQTILDKANESLEAATLLAEQGYYDFSASRAYYAMFYAVEPSARITEKSIQKRGTWIGNFTNTSLQFKTFAVKAIIVIAQAYLKDMQEKLYLGQQNF